MSNLKVSHISHSFHTTQNETPALLDINFMVKDGSFVSIVGPSGCGKSTLLSVLSGILEPESGSVTIDDKPLSQMRSRIGYMLQHDHLFEWRSVYGNVTLGLEINKTKTNENCSKVNMMLEQYGLSDFAASKPSELSGGMRQRAALIRTLALEPDILLLDEPFSALDYQTRLTVCSDIASIIRKEHKTAVMVTHDLSEAISVSDVVIVLSKRPGTVKSIIPIIFDSPDYTPIERRSIPAFKDYFNTLWKELDENE